MTATHPPDVMIPTVYDLAMAEADLREVNFDEVLKTLEGDLIQLAGETCARIYRDQPAYSGVVDARTLERAVGRNLDTALQALRQGRAPTSESLVQADTTAQERYEQGIPVEEVLLGFRVSISLIHERFMDVALRISLPMDLIVGGSRILWDVSDSFTSRIVHTYHGLELANALVDERRRRSAVQDLLAGRWTASTDLPAMDPRAYYAVVRCELQSSAGEAALCRQLEESGSSPGATALAVVDEGQCVAVVSRRPDVGVLRGGIGPFVELADLPRSNRVADECLVLMRRLGRSGLQGMEELGWRLAAATRTDVGRLYAERYLKPAEDMGGFGTEMLEAVGAWLRSGRSIPRAAAAMHVHVNTLRYRLQRYEQITGCNLESPDDLVALIWVLEFRHR